MGTREPEPVSLDALFRGARRGDGELWLRFASAMLNRTLASTVRRFRGLPRWKAEEVLHDALSAVWAKIEDFGSIRQVQVYIRRAVRVELLREASRERKLRNRLVKEGRKSACLSEHLAGSVEDRSDAIDSLEALKRGLGSRDFELFRLHASKEMSTAELAAAMGCSVRTCQRRLARIRAKARAIVDWQPE